MCIAKVVRTYIFFNMSISYLPIWYQLRYEYGKASLWHMPLLKQIGLGHHHNTLQTSYKGRQTFVLQNTHTFIIYAGRPGRGEHNADSTLHRHQSTLLEAELFSHWTLAAGKQYPVGKTNDLATRAMHAHASCSHDVSRRWHHWQCFLLNPSVMQSLQKTRKCQTIHRNRALANYNLHEGMPSHTCVTQNPA